MDYRVDLISTQAHRLAHCFSAAIASIAKPGSAGN
jgi:hypothetical protein